ncbi:MAG: YdcF family protein [Candidatus Tectomicrobia bacterium]|nr:YdcF family protein [Candidatus Tectomicrobia bacterium]
MFLPNVFLLKKVLTPFILPLTICLGLLILGHFLLWFSRRQRAARALLLAGTALLIALSFHGVTDRMIAALEDRYPPLLDPLKPAFGDGRAGEPIRWIFVLGGGHQKDPRLPATSHLSDSSLVRLAEGIRLQRLLPESRLILSGGRTSAPASEAEVMSEVAVQLGVSPSAIVLEPEALDTESQARAAPWYVGRDRFILVTSAAHMPRSMALFRRQGLRPIPAPTGHSFIRRAYRQPRDFLPSVSALDASQTVIYERMGYLWAWLRGRTAE